MSSRARQLRTGDLTQTSFVFKTLGDASCSCGVPQRLARFGMTAQIFLPILWVASQRSATSALPGGCINFNREHRATEPKC